MHVPNIPTLFLKIEFIIDKFPGLLRNMTDPRFCEFGWIVLLVKLQFSIIIFKEPPINKAAPFSQAAF